MDHIGMFPCFLQRTRKLNIPKFLFSQVYLRFKMGTVLMLRSEDTSYYCW